VAGVLGPHAVTVATTSTVTSGGQQVYALDDHVTIELGDKGAYHAVYTNSADYGREVTWIGGKLYLRPRYQRWHERAPEPPDEPDRLRDELYGALAAGWDLVAPGAELTDRGPVSIAGRAGRKVEVKLTPNPHPPATEPLVQRKWREQRTIDALAGEVVLDADKGVPLAVHLTGTISYPRDNQRYSLALVLDASVVGIGHAADITTPAAPDVVATPERLREVDDRDTLLGGMAPPLRKHPDGTAAPPPPPKR
jgi:hypothetical protein